MIRFCTIQILVANAFSANFSTKIDWGTRGACEDKSLQHEIGPSAEFSPRDKILRPTLHKKKKLQFEEGGGGGGRGERRESKSGNHILVPE